MCENPGDNVGLSEKGLNHTDLEIVSWPSDNCWLWNKTINNQLQVVEVKGSCYKNDC